MHPKTIAAFAVICAVMLLGSRPAAAFEPKYRLENFVSRSETARPSLSLNLNEAQDRIVLVYARAAKKGEAPSKLTSLTRLAGMFMGNVSALAMGNVKFCINLELR